MYTIEPVPIPTPEEPIHEVPDVPTPQQPSPGRMPTIDVPSFVGNIPCILYINSHEDININKDMYLEEIYKCDITIKDTCDIVTPEIIITPGNTNIDDANYMKLGQYYYFIRLQKMSGGNRYKIIGRRDALTSFKDYILSLDVIVDKNEYQVNRYLDDGSYITEQRANIEILNYPLGFEDSGRYILITAGGGN